MTNYSEVWSTLNQYQFYVDPQLLIVVTCSICQKLLIDACYGPCGCSYCRKCIEKYLENGMKYCPGNKANENCKLTELSMSNNIKNDVRANTIVLSLQVECPLDSCKHHDSLTEISNHLKICDKRQIPCPFKAIGCHIMELHIEQISTHLLKDIHQHSNLLSEWMINTKNDITTLFSQKYRDPIQNTSDNLNQLTQMGEPQEGTSFHNNETKQISSDDFPKELNLLTKNNNELMTLLTEMKKEAGHQWELSNNLKDTNTNLSNEVAHLRNLILKQKDEITELKKDRDEHFLKISNLEKALEVKSDIPGHKSLDVANLYKNYQPLFNAWTDPVTNTEIVLPNEKSQGSMELVNSTGSILWELVDLFDKRKGSLTLTSEYFYSLDGEQKFWLYLFPGGCNEHIGSHLCIQLIVCNRSNIGYILWPIKCKVTMNVKCKADPKLFKVLSRTCSLDPFKSELFHFAHSLLYQNKIFQKSDMIIECIVDKI